MTWHPLLIAITALDVTILVLLLRAGRVSLNVVLRWKPESSSYDQLLLERRVETADAMTHWAFYLMVCVGITTVVAIALILPKMVSGAMCGMGVVQALGGQALQLLILRGLAFCTLYWQRVLAGLNRYDPMSPLTLLLARVQLLATLLAVMAAYDSMTALFGHLDPSQPVSCCSVIYAQSPVQISTSWYDLIRQTPAWPISFGLASAGLGLLMVRERWYNRTGVEDRGPLMILVLGMIWSLTASMSLIFCFTPYIYQVLDHPCPFCLFLPEHYGIGFPLFLQILGAVVESPVLFGLQRLQATHPSLRTAICKRRSWTLAFLFVNMTGFALMALTPVLLWRWRFGVWI